MPDRTKAAAEKSCGADSLRLSRGAAIASGASSFLVALVGFLPTRLAATTALFRSTTAESTIAGKWALRFDQGTRQTLLNLRFDFVRSRDQIDVNLLQSRAATSFAVPAEGFFARQTWYLAASTINGISMSYLRQDAGLFSLERFDWRSTSGRVLFSPSSDYLAHVKRVLTLSPREQLELALSGATINDVNLIKSAFPDADVRTVILAKASGRDIRDRVAAKALLPSLSNDELLSFIGCDISSSYISELQRAGLHGVSAEDVRALKLSGVRGSFVQNLTTPDHTPSVAEILKAKLSAKSH